MKFLFMAIAVVVVLLSFSSDPMTLSEKIDKAHIQYSKASAGKAGNRSSYLPRAGETRGDDYKNCIDMKYYRNKNPEDFCGWHANIGKWRAYYN